MSQKSPQELQRICGRLSLALSVTGIGASHPLSARITTVRRNLTPGDTEYQGDAIAAKQALEAIVAELRNSPESSPPRIVAGTTAIERRSDPEPPAGVPYAIKQIEEAIKLLA